MDSTAERAWILPQCSRATGMPALDGDLPVQCLPCTAGATGAAPSHESLSRLGRPGPGGPGSDTDRTHSGSLANSVLAGVRCGSRYWYRRCPALSL